MGIPFQVTVDSHDAGGQVAFWSLALGYEPEPPPPGFDTWRDWYLSIGVPAEELPEGDCQDRIRDPEGRLPKIWFQPVPETKTVKNRVHLDVTVSGGRGVDMTIREQRVRRHAARLVAAGATELRVLSGVVAGHFAIVMQDPEGNEFCVN
ncbi:MAG: glyoxalase [Frankiales bacterium]|jgi:hypothetical protein|nr:glyoxalase [Frankiales bacterium]